MIPVEMEGNEIHSENWQDLLGIYQDWLQEETLNLNVVQDLNVQDLNPTPMQPMVQMKGNQNWIASKTTKNLDVGPSPNLYHGLSQAANSVSWNRNPNPSPGPNLYHGSNQASNSVPWNLNPCPSPSPSPNLYHGSNQASNSASWNLNPGPSPNMYHGSNQASNSVSSFRTNDRASYNLLETIVGIEKNSGSVSSTIGAQNNNVSALNQTLFQNPSMQVERNWAGSVSARSMIESQQIQTLTSNQVINNGYNSNQSPADGFPAPYRPCYDLNSPARSELDAVSSSIVGYFPFAPITPDSQGKHMNGFSVEVNTTPAINRHENQMVSIRSENADNNHYNEVLQTIGDSSSSVISTPQKECIVSEVGEEQGIDLNKTPQQKTPVRRKKHRPKVVREGKPKRTPKVKDPKKDPNETPVKRKYVRKQGTSNLETQNGNDVDLISPAGGPQSVGKRKYVRKKGVDHLESRPKSGVDELLAPVVENPDKSCKKRLNFDLESVNSQEFNLNVNSQEFNLNVNPQETEQEQRIKNILDTSQNQCISVMNNECIPTTPLAKSKERSLNVLARSLSMRKSIAGGDSLSNGYNLVNQHIHGGEIGNVIIQPGTTSTDLERRGVKRQSFEQMHPRNMNAMDSFLAYQKMSLGVETHNDDNNLGSIFLENHKKNKTQNEFQALVSSGPSLKDKSRQELLRKNGIYENGSALELLKSCIGRVNSSTVGQSQNVDKHHFQPSMAATQNLQKHQVSPEMQPNMERSIAERSQRSITAMVSWNPSPATALRASRSAVIPYPATLLQKKPTAKLNSSNQRLNGVDKMLQQNRNDSLEGRQRSSTKAKGRARKQNSVVSVDDITYLLEGLHIYNENEKEQNALVPYRADNAIIPFEPIKKRKPRPKVDLDPETDRLWRLLMGKDGGDSTETLDKDKEKWWENERKVFRGRADSFIARMHLVQGDRRFSRWKGSVVDSVIGVFLTQNVSDHLSSSAFMSLAAKFPLKSTTSNDTCCQDGVCVVVEEPIEIVEPNISVKGHEEIIISQDSFDSSTIQTVDEIRSSAGSNSEAEDQASEKPSMFKELFSNDNWSTPLSTNMHRLSKFPEHNTQIPNMSNANNLNISSGSTSNIFLPQESLASSSHFQRNTTPSQNKVSLSFDLFGGESIFSEAYHTISNINYEHNEIPRFQAPPLGQYKFLNSRQNLNNNRREVRDFFRETRENPEALARGKYDANRQDSVLSRGPTINAEDRISVVDKEKGLENTAAEANSKEQTYASQVSLSGQGTNVSKARKATTEDEKKRAFDWDSLRKQVLMSDEKSERRKDATDSLDYEALRRAHVSEIADAIRERGMNNMLADRIQDFLNRLVRDHGSIDLEWLRDVPPDKAKDYLLSIRGLGLKSVECVRLLTLHHLAFPVDTNVGRIAVRLGWVPLQPLPESLQLHLLEMYPVLESIQKYLWPRLCKLDQLTLYELHYQMITFGKVFCTKSKPNCNACPMRAECRHFASAFASARLALPGPEEKGIVPSHAPIATNTIPSMPSRPPMMLPPAANDYNEDTRLFGRDCAPIIEEPTTPEPEIAELSISDIEDQYYEDQDEIPTIKLNMEEFTTNLQNIMQDNMELQGDMSKALVALNPEAASIPTPKLKNVSRLRTEHQVYELPDSHPLLEGLGKREVDDPSPYLLAIWTPGETANSVQTPEERCPDQELGKLCDRTTCFSCNSVKEANSQVVRGTILIPCRTAMRGSFPLNGTYFQVNEMFADHASSMNPIDVPRSWIWNLPRRTVYFGTSVSTIFKGLTTEGIQYCFWRGFVCVRGFDQKSRAPRPLMARLHFPASKLVKTKNESK